MKTRNYLLSLLAIMLTTALSVSLVSCGDDDNDGKKDDVKTSSIIGKWNVVKEHYEEYQNGVLVNSGEEVFYAPYDYIEFTANTYAYYECGISPNGGVQYHIDSSGSWWLDGNSFKFNGGEEFTKVEITKYDGKNSMEILFQEIPEYKGDVLKYDVWRWTLQRVVD